jgi:Flp pilus assembly protein TadG
MFSAFCGRLAALCEDEGGLAAIEFGLIAPFLVLLVVAAIDLGTGIHKAMQAQNAAEAGAVYASRHAFDLTGTTGAVVNATAGAGIVATPAPTRFCGCPTASGIATTSCGAACADGSAPGQYLRISARVTHSPLLSIAGLGGPSTIAGEAVIRIY